MTPEHFAAIVHLMRLAQRAEDAGTPGAHLVRLERERIVDVALEQMGLRLPERGWAKERIEA